MVKQTNINKVFNCPNCNQEMFIEKLNCGIFRHAYKKSTMKQTGPHCKLAYIERLRKANNLIGCGAAFKIDKKTLEISICSYDL